MKDSIKIQLVKVERMSEQGLKNWSPNRRHRVNRQVFKAQRSLGPVPLEDLYGEEKISELVWIYGGEGTWDVRATCPNKHARFGFTQKTLARVTVAPHPENEFSFQTTEFQRKRLYRYRKMLKLDEVPT